MRDALRVVETFGPTLQGEGPAAGSACLFLRLAGCNLSCSWCDSAFTWDATRYRLEEETVLATPARIAEALGMPDPPLPVVVTGGEPLLQQDTPGWEPLLATLSGRGQDIHVETNGTIAPSAASLAAVAQWVVSPKLANAGPHRGHQNPLIHPAWLAQAGNPRVALKFVCLDATDVAQAAEMAEIAGWPPERVWVMPEGTSAEVLVERWPVIAEAAAAAGLNASHRLHVLAWGDERGR